MRTKTNALSLIVVLGALAAVGACKTGEPNDVDPHGNADAGHTPDTGEDDSDAGLVPDSGSPADGGNHSDGGTRTDAGTPTDAGTSTDAGTGVLCGTNEMDARVCSAPNVCCVTPSDGGVVAECLPHCTGGAAVSCDGPEDCSGSSKYCCFSGRLTTFLGNCIPSQIKSQCQNSCALQVPTGCSGTAQGTVCRSKADCAGNGIHTECCPLQLGSGANQFVTVCTDGADAENCLP